MKTTKIIRDKKEVIKKFITGMYESICMQKELLELLLQVIEEEEPILLHRKRNLENSLKESGDSPSS